MTENDLNRFFPQNSITRGRRYAREGRVFHGMKNYSSLVANVEGSAPKPYEVQVTVDPDGVDGWCSCPVGFYGDCKHIYAAALTFIRSPQSFLDLSELTQTLTQGTHEVLVDMLLRVFMDHPETLKILYATYPELVPSGPPEFQLEPHRGPEYEDEAFMEHCREAGREDLVLDLLLHRSRGAEVVEFLRDYARDADFWNALFQKMSERELHGIFDDLAIAVVLRAGIHGQNLLVWLVETWVAGGHREEAVRLLQVLFRRHEERGTYDLLRDTLSQHPDAWRVIRGSLWEYLEGRGRVHLALELMVAEGDFVQAAELLNSPEGKGYPRSQRIVLEIARGVGPLRPELAGPLFQNHLLEVLKKRDLAKQVVGDLIVEYRGIATTPQTYEDWRAFTKQRILPRVRSDRRLLRTVEKALNDAEPPRAD